MGNVGCRACGGRDARRPGGDASAGAGRPASLKAHRGEAGSVDLPSHSLWHGTPAPAAGSAVIVDDDLCEANGERGRVLGTAGGRATVEFAARGEVTLPLASLRPPRGTQPVRGDAVWEGGMVFRCTVGPEGHVVAIEPGPGGTYQAPMQALLSALASCAASGVVEKSLKKGCSVDALHILIRAARIPGSIFERVELDFVVTSPDVDPEWFAAAVAEHTCSVGQSISQTTEIVASGEVRRGPVSPAPPAAALAAAGAASAVAAGRQLVTGVAEWMGGQLFRSTVGAEQHVLTVEPGPGGSHQAPMQVLLAASASCAASGLVQQALDRGHTVDAFRVSIDAMRIPGSVFERAELRFALTSPDADPEWFAAAAVKHTCSVNKSIVAATHVVMSGEVVRPSK